MQLPKISGNKITKIEALVNESHLEELMETIGEENYTMLLEFPLTFEEQSRMFSLMDMLLHTEKEEKLLFSQYGERIEQFRLLNDTIYTHLTSYTYSLIADTSKEYPFAKAIIEAVMFDLLREMINSLKDVEEVYDKHYLAKSLEKDLSDYTSLDTRERTWFRNVFASMNDSADPLTQYRIQLSLRDAGTTMEELAQQV